MAYSITDKNLFSENAKVVAIQKYASNDEEKEDIALIFQRIAYELSKVSFRLDEKGLASHVNKQDEFYDIMRDKKFMPAGRTLTNAGTDSALIANCVVLGIDDTMESIMEVQKQAVLLQQQGCGIGFNFSSLRPAGYVTKRSRGLASGPISFMRMYNNAFLTIKQQGRSGANMGMMDVRHPDTWSFISCKEHEGDFSTFNISVVVDDGFMRVVRDNPNKKFMSKWNYEEVSPRSVRTIRDRFGETEEVTELDITYGQMFARICEYAHRNGEPGIMFVDEVNRHNPLPMLGRITASNPCGEQMLHPGDNCNLGSINVAAHFDDEKSIIDWEDLKVTVAIAVEMLDNTIELFDHSVELINETAVKNRRIGLGIMGFADLLYKMNVRYGSYESFDIAEELMRVINKYAWEASVQLGKERGCFENINLSIYAGRDVDIPPIVRNVARTTIAPTGSISMLCDVNGGIEPYFGHSFMKRTRSGNLYYLPKALEIGIRRAFLFTQVEVILIEMMRSGQNLFDVVNRLGYDTPRSNFDAYVTTEDVSPMEHVEMQMVFQKHVDNSISKTINLPNSATIDDVHDIYLAAWEQKCKSITIYRDGSRQHQIIEHIADKKELTHGVILPAEESRIEMIHKHEYAPRPKVVNGYTQRVRTFRGNVYVTMNFWEYHGVVRPFEVFAAIGKEGGELHSSTSALTRMISWSLRYGMPIEAAIKTLKNIGSQTMYDEGEKNEGPVDAIARTMEKNTHKASRRSNKSG